mgnify:CR=1 FL=1
MPFWTGEQRGFAVTAYLENGRSCIRAQRSFGLNFHLPPRAPAPSVQVISVWANNLHATDQTTIILYGDT